MLLILSVSSRQLTWVGYSINPHPSSLPEGNSASAISRGFPFSILTMQSKNVRGFLRPRRGLPDRSSAKSKKYSCVPKRTNKPKTSCSTDDRRKSSPTLRSVFSTALLVAVPNLEGCFPSPASKISCRRKFASGFSVLPAFSISVSSKPRMSPLSFAQSMTISITLGLRSLVRSRFDMYQRTFASS